jgi:helicase
MTKDEFLERISIGIETTLKDYRFDNYRKQVLAWRIGPHFERTFEEDFIWKKLLYVTTNASILVNEGVRKQVALESLKSCAELYENLGYVSEKYDRGFCLVLASLCYDLAGYQANALCVARDLKNYEFNTNDNSVEISTDNYILKHVQLILQKSIPAARLLVNKAQIGDPGRMLFDQAVDDWYATILVGAVNDYRSKFDDVNRYFLNSGNIPTSQLLFLLNARIKMFDERSIWGNIRKFENLAESTRWTRYIRLLTNAVYDHNELRPVESRISRFEFWTSQLRALEKGLLDSESNLVVQMPTSAGKTFVAELAILDALVKYPGKKCIYIAPFRALTAEKEADLAENISKLGFAVSALSGSYEIDAFQDVIVDDSDVLVATPEKIDLLFRVKPDYFDNVALIVVDEGHIVGDLSSRATLLEFLIIRLKLRLDNVRFLFISAVMPKINADQYSVWLSGEKDNVVRSLIFPDLADEWEPTRRLIGSFRWVGDSGRLTYIDVDTEDELTRIKSSVFVPSFIRKKQYGGAYPDGKTKAQSSASLTIELSKTGSCLVFCAQPRDTKTVGNAVLKILAAVGDEIPSHFKPSKETRSYFFASQWFGAENYVTKCIERGIGVHYGDMPESVRRAIEEDYRAGNLRVLISTNTIGQGINFPIKYLIVHSTIVSFQEKSKTAVKISVRDFWNIVGRAGRAGRETEGQVIFVVHTDVDDTSFRKLTNKEGIEDAVSMMVKVLGALTANRITAAEFENYTRILVEPYLLTLLVEESVETEAEVLVEQIIGSSLFKIQAEAEGMDIQPLFQSLRGVVRRIRENVDPQLLSAFAQTGFTLQSNIAIVDFVEAHRAELIEIIQTDNYQRVLELLLVLIDSGGIEEMRSRKLNRLNSAPSAYVNVLFSWIKGDNIEAVKEAFSAVDADESNLMVLMSDGFYYRYPWLIAAFETILFHLFGMNRDEGPVSVRHLSSFVKYGVDNPTACLARSFGIQSREVASRLAESSGYKSGREFREWLVDLATDDIRSFELGAYDQRNVLDTAFKIAPNAFRANDNGLLFEIKGTFYNLDWRENSYAVNILERLTYSRDYANEFDSFAIVLLQDTRPIGFVPRKLAMAMAIEIDLGISDYIFTVLNVGPGTDYNRITVSARPIAPNS